MNTVLHKTNFEDACNLIRSASKTLPAMILVALFTAGCGTLENGRGWGQDAFFPIVPERLSRAAHDAFFDSQTLIPLAGAAVFAIDDLDERASDWAVKHNPVFGSAAEAIDASDSLRDILHVEAIVTALATPSGDDPGQWAFSKLRGIGVELVAMGVTHSATSRLKDATDRTRPSGGDDRSFPSSHTSSAFSYMTLANRNLDSIRMPRMLRPALKVGNTLLAASVAWARVEGEQHYPSDVLAGAALGYFATAFIHDAFLNLPEDSNVDFAIFPIEGGAGIELSLRF
jgi:hypothetical protein